MFLRISHCKVPETHVIISAKLQENRLFANSKTVLMKRHISLEGKEDEDQEHRISLQHWISFKALLILCCKADLKHAVTCGQHL